LRTGKFTSQISAPEFSLGVPADEPELAPLRERGDFAEFVKLLPK
jgi:hypothetical protein